MNLKEFFEKIKQDQSKNIPLSVDATLCSCEVINALRFAQLNKKKKLRLWEKIRLWVFGIKKRN